MYKPYVFPVYFLVVHTASSLKPPHVSALFIDTITCSLRTDFNSSCALVCILKRVLYVLLLIITFVIDTQQFERFSDSFVRLSAFPYHHLGCHHTDTSLRH